MQATSLQIHFHNIRQLITEINITALDPELVNYKPLRIEDIGAFMKQNTPEIRRILGVDRFGQELNAEDKLNMLKDILSVFRMLLLMRLKFTELRVSSLPMPV